METLNLINPVPSSSETPINNSRSTSDRFGLGITPSSSHLYSKSEILDSLLFEYRWTMNANPPTIKSAPGTHSTVNPTIIPITTIAEANVAPRLCSVAASKVLFEYPVFKSGDGDGAKSDGGGEDLPRFGLPGAIFTFPGDGGKVWAKFGAALDEIQSLHPFVVVASLNGAVIAEEFNQIVGQHPLITFV